MPKFLYLLKTEGYSWAFLQKDLTAGLIIAIITVPMAISFAISSGVRPEQGLITAIIGGILVSIIGGSRHQVSGPTGAFIVLIYAIVSQYGYEGLALATLFSGVILILAGLFKFGSIVKFIPYPVVVGLTSGLALIIFTNQVADFLGLTLTQAPPPSYIGRIKVYWDSIGTLNYYSLGIGMLTIFISFFWKKVFAKIPGSLIAILICTLLVAIFKLPTETLGSRFGTIPSNFPPLHLPNFSCSDLMGIISSGISISILAGMESLLSCVVADGMTGTKHRPDSELVAQGVGNIFSILFSGIPITAGFARTAANIKNGAKTPLASFFNGVFLLLIMLFFGKWMFYIPICTLAGILFIIAYNMSEWRQFSKLLSYPKSDVIVLLATFFITVFVGLIHAIQMGVILSVFLFAYRIVSSCYGKYLKEKTEEEVAEDPWNIKSRDIPKEIEVFEIEGPFFFAAVEKFKTALYGINCKPKVLIIRLRNVPFIDATGIHALDDILAFTKREKITLLISGAKKGLVRTLKKVHFYEKIENGHFFANIDEALLFAKSFLPHPDAKLELENRSAIKNLDKAEILKINPETQN